MRLSWMAAGVLALAALAGLLTALMEPVTHAQLTATTGATPRTSAANPDGEAAANFIYGRVTTDHAVFEGRLRWGGDQEALWSNYFNGAKRGNPWVDHVPNELRPRHRESIEIFGITLARWTEEVSLARPFMARFGDITRVDRYSRREWRITLKSGAVVRIAWGGADDMNDGVRVWDKSRGIVNVEEWGIRTIELLDSPSSEPSPSPLYGTVRTRQGDFTGLVQWNRTQCLASDELVGQNGGGALRVRFDTIRSIARHSADSALVSLVDGRAVVLSGSRKIGHGNGGIYVDDKRYGRVLVSWDAFERVDFRAGGDSAPAYGDYPVGRPLTGTVITRSGRRLAGRLVYDLDESQTTETLDAPSQGIDYTLPFSLIASIIVPDGDARDGRRATVTLRTGEELQLEQSGDLGAWDVGILIFVEGRQQPEYVPWSEVKQIYFDQPERKATF